MSIPVIRGDILQSDADIIVQQVNCQGVMGAGLAKQIASQYPGVLSPYKKMCNMRDTQNLLGKVLICPTRAGVRIANIFGQDRYGRDGCYTDYAALENGLVAVVRYASRKNLSVAIPHGIGCGLAGGDWTIVSEIINRVFENCPNVMMYQI